MPVTIWPRGPEARASAKLKGVRFLVQVRREERAGGLRLGRCIVVGRRCRYASEPDDSDGEAAERVRQWPDLRGSAESVIRGRARVDHRYVTDLFNVLIG